MRVLIAVDQSPYSQAALDAVADRSWPEATEFRIISAMEPLSVQYGYAGAYGIESVIALEQKLQGYRKQYVDEKAAKLSLLFGKGRVSGEVLEGFPAEEIIADAEKWHADLIVVGSHGRKGMQKFLLGSVAERVVSHSPCSVEVVKSKVEKEHCDKDHNSKNQDKVLSKTGKKG